MPTAARKRARSPEVQAYFDAVEAHEQLAYVRLLGMKSNDAEELHERVKQGVTYAALERIQRTLDLSMSLIAELLFMPPRTLHRRKERGRLKPDESDRLLRLSRVLGKALELFEGDVESARSWLEAPHAALGDNTPLELARTEPGVTEVEALIGRLEHGVIA